MEIIITDVTDMSGGHICVAGWSPDEERMVRPLPLHASGHPHWTADMARKDLFCPGNIITVEPTGQLPNRGKPHAVDDCLIRGTPTLTGNLSDEEMIDAVSGSIHDSVLSLFGDAFTDKKYVPENQGDRSLGAVEVRTQKVRFYDDNKFICWFVDSDDEKYSFKITCRALNDLHMQSGIEGLNELKSGKRKAHIRLGLANAWDGRPDNNWNPKHCYAMMNGIFFI